MKCILAFCVALCASTAVAQSIPRGHGVNVHFSGSSRNSELQMIAAAGLNFVRNDLFWQYTETQKGVYRFTQYDQFVAGCEANGLKILFTLDYNNPLYQSGGDKAGPNSLAVFQAYARWATEVVKHFAGRGIVWEFWNEPNNTFFWGPQINVNNYCQMAILAANSIRAAAPGEILIGPSATFTDSNVIVTANNGRSCLAYLDNCFKLGLLNTVDGISIHAYRPNHTAPETIFPFYAGLQTVMNRYSPQRPVIDGEHGYSRTEVNEIDQAYYCVREYLCNDLAGVPLTIWYDWSDDGTDLNNREHNFGLVGNTFNATANPPRTPHIAYKAVQALHNATRGATLVGRTPLANSSNYLLRYSNGVMVVWGVDQNTASLGLSDGTYKVKNHLGTAMADLVVKGGASNFIIKRGVSYISPATGPIVAAASIKESDSDAKSQKTSQSSNSNKLANEQSSSVSSRALNLASDSSARKSGAASAAGGQSAALEIPSFSCSHCQQDWSLADLVQGSCPKCGGPVKRTAAK